MAVAMGFVQLFSGLGQVSGVSISSALFQTILNRELRERLHGPGSEELIEQVKHSSEMVRQLPLDLQRPVRDSYVIALRAIFILAACCTVLAFLVRIPASLFLPNGGNSDIFHRFQSYRWMRIVKRKMTGPQTSRMPMKTLHPIMRVQELSRLARKIQKTRNDTTQPLLRYQVDPC